MARNLHYVVRDTSIGAAVERLAMKNNGSTRNNISDISTCVRSTHSIESIANFILGLVLSETKSRSGSILLMDEYGHMRLKAAKGIQYELFQTLKIRPGEKICGQVAKTGRPLLVKDINTDRTIKKSKSKKYDSASFISCPIIMCEHILGVINVTDKIDGRPFTEKEMDVVTMLAGQAAFYLEYARLTLELLEKNNQLDNIIRELVDSDSLKSEFIARMSHEFRTPLNAITGAVYYLKENKLPNAEKKDFISIISDESKKLIRLLDDILDISFLEKEEALLHKRVISLADIVTESLTSGGVPDVMNENGISIHNRLTDGKYNIVGDRVRLLQAIRNIMDGITQYTSPGDSIEINALEKKKSVELRLLIKGRAVPESELPFIFSERSLWSGKEVIRNNLRFYLAKKSLDLYNGKVSIKNSSKGIVISLAFPRILKEYRDAEVNELLSLFLSFLSEAMHINKCSLMLKDDKGGLTIRSAIGIEDGIVRTTRLRPGENIAGHVLSEKKALLIEDVEKFHLFPGKSAERYYTKSLLSLPIEVNGKIAGVLNLNNKADGTPFTGKDFYLASAMAERISRILANAQNSALYDNGLRSLIRNMEHLAHAERQYAKGNGSMSSLVFDIMRHMESSEEELKSAMYASTLYDIGLTQIDERIIFKTKRLTDIEQRILKTHPFPSVEMIHHLEADNSVIQMILHHHEHYDGSGYPDGLKGYDIPFISRVIAVVDAFTAITSDRPYRKARSTREALRQINAGTGKQFDPGVVSALNKII